MKGRKPYGYRLRAAERHYLREIVGDGQQRQRVATRARTLLVLDRGERIVEIIRWLGISRMGIWHLWRRYQQHGVRAIFDGERSGRPVVFPPLVRVQIERMACTEPAAYGLHLTHWDCRSLQQVVVEQAVVAAIHYMTVARILAAASLQPHRSRYWKTATIDEEFTTRAAKVLWCYERVDWLHQRIATKAVLKRALAAVKAARNATRATVDWRLTTTQARVKLRRLYPSTSL